MSYLTDCIWNKRKIVLLRVLYLRGTVLPLRCTQTTCRAWYPNSMPHRLLSCRFNLLRVRLLLMSSRVSGSLTPCRSLPFLRRAWRVTRGGETEEVDVTGGGAGWTRHSVQEPKRKLKTISLPSQCLGAHVRNSVRLGHGMPPNSGGARTERARFCSPKPHVLEQDVHGLNCDTTQSLGHGIRQACSSRGLGSKYSQMESSAGEPSVLSTQLTSRVWIPASPCKQCPLPPECCAKGEHRFQEPSCQSYSSRCQSQTRKQLCWLAGRDDCWQLVGSVVQPSTWAHHTARLWLPPGPHSLPIHLPQGPEEKRTKEKRQSFTQCNTLTYIFSDSKRREISVVIFDVTFTIIWREHTERTLSYKVGCHDALMSAWKVS